MIINLNTLIEDAKNFNRGTDAGRELVAKSLRKLKAGRSVLVDKNNRIIAGNKTVVGAMDAGINEAIVIETDGEQLVVVKRTDLDLETDVKARELSFVDNRTSQVGLEWNVEELNNFLILNPQEILGMDAEFLASLDAGMLNSDDVNIEKESHDLTCPKCGYVWEK